MSFADRGKSGPIKEICRCIVGGRKFMRVKSQTIRSSARASAGHQILIGSLAD